jgi:hypothetical protein
MILQTCRAIVCGDRIRVAPSEGRLLRLSPPCVLMIGSETVQIVSRTVSESSAGPIVLYDCDTEFGAAVLSVRLLMNQCCEVTWQAGTSEASIAESDVVVFG